MLFGSTRLSYISVKKLAWNKPCVIFGSEDLDKDIHELEFNRLLKK